jgi:ribosomal protein S18 acetylase RimI-like enzyme
MGFSIRELDKKNKEDMIFFKKLEFESFKTTIKNAENFTEEELIKKFKEFDENDPIDVYEPEHKIFTIEGENDEKAGLIWIAEREPFWRFEEKLVWIYNIHVLPEYRGKGLAKMLMEKIEEWTKMKGYKIIALHVIDDNIAARKLYEVFDYKLVATHNESFFYEKQIS